ncbi:MAG: amidohydrolase family protein [Thermoleophilaceae bacterium]|nr:amidohydrolase family protein [Thermoleophilaceae bacterium]
MSARLLVAGGHVLSGDAGVGEIAGGDVLVEDGAITAVGTGIDAGDADRLDASGCVVMPGFVDTHRHTWQTALRGLCSDWSLTEYFRGVRQTFSPRYRPEDVLAGNLAGALEALDAGVTSILDFSHCVNSPAHADAAIEGLRGAGIRGVWAYGYYPTSGPEPAFADHLDRIADARRIAGSGELGPLLSMGVALTETGLLPWDLTRAEIESATELDALLTAHTGCVWGSQMCMGVREMEHHGLLGPSQVHVHCNALTDAELDMLALAGAGVSCTPETELQMGMGAPVLRRWLERDRVPSLGCDIVSGNSGDMFAQMRIGLQWARSRDNDAVIAETGVGPDTIGLGVRDAIRWATLGGAEALGMEGSIGSLSPGKQADLIVIGGERMGLTPLGDPAGAVVQQASATDVRDVLVAGVRVKRNGVLVNEDAGRARRLVRESREYLYESVLAAGPLLPDPLPGFAEGLAATAEQNLEGGGVRG